MSATTTRVRLNDGRFGTVKNLFSGNGSRNGNGSDRAEIQVGEKDLQTFLKEARKAYFTRMVEKGKSLLLEATMAVGRKDSAGALRAIWKDEYACACYLTSEKGKRDKRYVHVSEGFQELENMEEFLSQKAKEVGQELPQKPKRR